MPVGLAPGVHVAAPPPARRQPFASDTAGFVGVAERGPVGEAVTLTGWAQFVAIFGGFLPNAFLAYAVRAFFDNGGRRCVVVRAIAPERRFASLGAQPADGVSSIIDKSEGLRPGAMVTLTQDVATATAGAQPADRLSSLVGNAHGFGGGMAVLLLQASLTHVARVQAVDVATNTVFWREPLPATLNLAAPVQLTASSRGARLITSVAGTTIGWDRPLEGRLDPALPLTMAAGAGVAGGTVPDEDGHAVLAIEAIDPGQWGNRVSVAVTSASDRETTTRVRDVPDAPDFLSVDALTGFAVGAFVEALQDAVPTARRIIVAIDRAGQRLRLDTPLPGGFSLTDAASGVRPIRLRRRGFSLSVYADGRLVETHANLDLPVIGAWAELASRFIRIRREGSVTYAWPDPASPLLDRGRRHLAGGRDGVAMLRPADLLGRPDDAVRLGLRRFELADEPSALAMPDAVIPPTPAIVRDVPEPPKPDDCALCPGPAIPPPAQPAPARIEASPTFSPDDVRQVQHGLLEHCELRGDRVALLDPPLASGPDPYALDALLRWRQDFDSSYAAAYFPWPAVVDPLASGAALSREVPACGHALGQFSLADAAPGHNSPANFPLAWTARLARDLNGEEHALLNGAGVNVLRNVPGRGPRIMGARTLSSQFDWTFLAVRRLVVQLKRQLYRALEWAPFEPNDQGLADLVVATVEGFLEEHWIAQRLRGRTPDEAFYVTPRTTQDDFDNGRFVLEIGIAPSLPAEFIILRLARNEDRFEIAEADAGGWPP